MDTMYRCCAGLDVGLTVEAVAHVPPVPCCWRLGRRPADVGRDDRTHAHVLSCDAMIGFGVVPRVGDGDLHRHPPPRVQQQSLEERLVPAAAGRRAHGEDQVTGAGHRDRELGQSLDRAAAAAVHRRGMRAAPLFCDVFFARRAALAL